MKTIDILLEHLTLMSHLHLYLLDLAFINDEDEVLSLDYDERWLTGTKQEIVIVKFAGAEIRLNIEAFDNYRERGFEL